MKKTVLSLTVLVALCGIMFSELANTSSPIPPVSRTGAPMEGNCAGCHSGNFNTGSGDILFSMAGMAYVPDSTYNITLSVVDSLKTRHGFQITVLDDNNNGIGTFTVTNTINTSAQLNLGRQYINQKNATSNGTWSFDWTAPDTNVGPITFYACGNATNFNSGVTGDNVYTRSYTLETCNISLTNTIIGSYSDTSGAIDLTVVNGIGPYTYLWSNGDTAEDLNDLISGDYTVSVTDGSNCKDTVTINVPIWISARELISEMNFNVFPNPSSGQFSLQSLYKGEEVQIRIYNIQGQLVYEQKEVDLNGILELDLAGNGTGIYTMVVSNDNETKYKKLIFN